MKSHYKSLVYLALVQTATNGHGVFAEPQQLQQQQSTSSTAVSTTQQQQMPVGGSPSLAPADLGTNAVGFSDSNRAGFNPFAIGKQDKHVGAKTFLATMTIASVIATLVIVEPWGIAAAVLLQGIAMFFQPTPPNPDQIYQAIYGRIQNQINTAINNKEVSKLVSNLQTLSQNVNDQTVSYLAQLGITGNTQQTLQGMAQGTVAIPFVTAGQVDGSMKVIDNILAVPNNWYTAPSQVNISTAFALTGVAGMGANYCLHTKNFNLADGSDLAVDTQCNLNSMDDKLWGIAPNGQLVLRTNNGDKCVAFNSKNGDDHSKHLAIFDINSKQCASSRPIKLLQAADGTFSLYDGNRMLCVGDGTKDKDADVIVSTETFHSWNHWFGTHNRCKNNNALQFQTRIPIVLNTAGAGGATGNSVTPPNTFDEIGVQLFYFSHFASFHLAGLKEMYLHGESTAFAQSQYNIKVQEYKAWISTFVPVFELYANFAGINATAQIQDAKNFYGALTKATLAFPAPIPIQI